MKTNIPTGNIEVAGGKVFKWSAEPVSPISAAHGLSCPSQYTGITCRQAAINFSCRLKSNSNPRVAVAYGTFKSVGESD